MSLAVPRTAESGPAPTRTDQGILVVGTGNEREYTAYCNLCRWKAAPRPVATVPDALDVSRKAARAHAKAHL